MEEEEEEERIDDASPESKGNRNEYIKAFALSPHRVDFEGMMKPIIEEESEYNEGGPNRLDSNYTESSPKKVT